MALSFKDIYQYDAWIATYDNAQGYEERYRGFCRDFVLKSEFPSIEVKEIDMVSGGWFSKDKTPAIEASFKKSKLKSLAVYFRAMRFGNVMYYSLIKTVDRGFLSSSDRTISKLIDKLENLSQVDEFYSLDGLGDLVFHRALLELDPTYKEMKSLVSRTSNQARKLGDSK